MPYADKTRERSFQADYREVNRLKHRSYFKRHFRKVKVEVLTRYGKDGALQCCWGDCDVTDLDMLTIDHINDDGVQDRRSRGPKGKRCHGGATFYVRLRKDNYPSGYQTLCWNHQWKKRITKLGDN